MPFNEEKSILIQDFLSQLHEKIKTDAPSSLIFFEAFLKDQLIEDFREEFDLPANWGKFVNVGLVNAGDFDQIYPMAAAILYEAAGRNYSEVHPDIYKEAHGISTAFCELLNEVFECSGDDGVFDLIPIVSFAEAAIAAGVVTVKKPE